nr:MAG TPA: hypothetical protein [Caudoviricetes sp.]
MQSTLYVNVYAPACVYICLGYLVTHIYIYNIKPVIPMF